MFSKIIRKKNKRTLNYIGENFYHFNYGKEKLIYKYVCYERLKKKELKKINSNQKFDSYLQWKLYICNKYKDYPKNKLLNFSRYLNQRVKRAKPFKEYTSIFITACLSCLITELVDTLIKTEDLSDYPLWSKIFCLLIVFISMFYIIYEMIKSMSDNNFKENFFNDYKEIIDEMLNKDT